MQRPKIKATRLHPHSRRSNVRATTSSSNVHRRVRCFGSHWAEHGLPETDSEQSQEGTQLHHALHDTAAFNALDVKAQDLVNFTWDLFAEVNARAIATFAIAPDEPYIEGFERELVLRQGIRPVLTGHCDYWRIYPERHVLIIPDAKFGRIEVTPAPLNLQLRSYAVQAADDPEWKQYEIEHVVTAIAQPRAPAFDGADKLTVARYDSEDLELAKKQLLAWEKEWLNPEAKRTASEDACRYCKAKAMCDTYAARVKATRGYSKEQGLADVSNDDFVSAYEAMRLAQQEDYKNQMMAEARVRAAEGRMPGYRLKPNAPKRFITDNVKASKLLIRKLHFDVDQVYEASSLSFGEVEKVVRQVKADRGEKIKVKDIKPLVNEHLAEVIGYTDPEPSVIPMSEHDQAKTV